MQGFRHRLLIMRQRTRAGLESLIPEAGASLRLGHAFVLGSIGMAALAVAAVIGIEPQRSLESRALRIRPVDEQSSGYFLVDPSVEPIVQATDAPWPRPSSLLWLASAMLLAAGGLAAWYMAVHQKRWRDERVQRFRRARATHVPARTAAKRQAILAWFDSAGQDPRRARLTVRQLMTDAFVVASPTASIQTLNNLLDSGPLRHVMICEYGGRLLGIVTHRDLQYRRGKRAVDVMTRAPVCVPPGALLGPAATLMVDHQISCLPVVEQGHVHGVLTADDLALALDCVLQNREAAQLRQTPFADETTVLADIETLCATARASDSGTQPDSAPPDGVRS
jgi:acetoin utilization protein AcuB